MIDAAITRVEANLSVIRRFSSSIALAHFFSSRASARFMMPISAARSVWACRSGAGTVSPGRSRWADRPLAGFEVTTYGRSRLWWLWPRYGQSLTTDDLGTGLRTERPRLSRRPFTLKSNGSINLHCSSFKSVCRFFMAKAQQFNSLTRKYLI
jgi:hypothetical protein